MAMDADFLNWAVAFMGGAPSALDAKMGPAPAQSLFDLPTVQQAAEAEAAPAAPAEPLPIGCPTCFVPAMDLPPDEHAVNVNLYGTIAGMPCVDFAFGEAQMENSLPAPPAAVDSPAVADVDALPVADVALVPDTTDELFGSLFLGMPTPDVDPLPLTDTVLAPPVHVAKPAPRPEPKRGRKAKRRDGDTSWSGSDATTSGSEVPKPAKGAGRQLPPAAVDAMKQWLLSPEHFDHPYPTDAEKAHLAASAGITVKQVTIWFTNARKRLWAPLRRKQNLPIIPYADYRKTHGLDQPKRRRVGQSPPPPERRPAPRNPEDTRPPGSVPLGDASVPPVLALQSLGTTQAAVTREELLAIQASIAAERERLAKRLADIAERERALSRLLQP